MPSTCPIGDRVWFGRDGDEAGIVAAGSPGAVLDRVAPLLTDVEATLAERG